MRHVTLLQLSHITMHVVTSNRNYLLLFCDCFVHCNHMHSVAKLFIGILTLQLMPARDAPAAISPATVPLVCLQNTTATTSMPPSATDQTSLWPGSSHRCRGTPSPAGAEQRITTINHASNAIPPFCQVSQVCCGGRAVWRKTTSEVASSAAGVAWSKA